MKTVQVGSRSHLTGRKVMRCFKVTAFLVDFGLYSVLSYITVCWHQNILKTLAFIKLPGRTLVSIGCYLAAQRDLALLLLVTRDSEP